ncbi:MAG: HD domain-containing protein [Desulfarculales bacterium]|jgi:putative nucleotidyltransferase with HDIG domain|nr:HD domain-containing protein [Desulfarculales bacterium]
MPPLTPELPSRTVIMRLWDRYGMLPNIKNHSFQVCNVALTLWQWLGENNYYLNRDMVESGALLHDVAKAYCLDKPHLSHNLEGERIVAEAGYPELGLLVARHVNLPEDQPLDETLLVFYADKRVVGDKIVSVKKRYQYVYKVYGQNSEEGIARIRYDENRSYEVEKQIFRHICGRQPEDLCHIRSFNIINKEPAC